MVAKFYQVSKYIISYKIIIFQGKHIKVFDLITISYERTLRRHSMIETQLFNRASNICKQIQFSIRFNSMRLGKRYTKSEMHSGFCFEISAIRFGLIASVNLWKNMDHHLLFKNHQH